MPYCEHCGNEVAETAVACPNCGHPQRGRAPAAPVAGGVRRTEGTAVASLALGIAGLFICPLIGGILAVVFGRQAQAKIAADPTLEGEGMAKAGVILGWAGIGLTIAFVVFAMAGAAFSVAG